VLHKLDETEDDKVSAQFHNELTQLKRFNGLVHEHLITLLATYTLRNNYYFIFPCADGTLEDYWEITERTPKMDIATARWVSKQCAGIMTAIDAIHEPKGQQNLAVKRYGRHGDIKPDNILWFHSIKDPKGILTISDMGLTSFNRDTSRSNIPGSRLPGAPGYRPPECEIKGGTVNRSFDIWTLGCLFLELFTWLLGGYHLIEEFSKHRSSVFILTGGQNNIFFTLKAMYRRVGYVAQVKPQVTEVCFQD
jgi:serine/threonine protein kinase